MPSFASPPPAPPPSSPIIVSLVLENISSTFRNCGLCARITNNIVINSGPSEHYTSTAVLFSIWIGMLNIYPPAPPPRSSKAFIIDRARTADSSESLLTPSAPLSPPARYSKGKCSSVLRCSTWKSSHSTFSSFSIHASTTIQIITNGF